MPNKLAEGKSPVEFEGDILLRHALLEAAAVVIVLSLDFTILEFNREAERVYGVDRGAVIGKSYIQTLIPPEARAQVEADGRKVLAGEPTKGFENPIKGVDGQEFWLSWYVNRLLGADGRPLGVVAVGHDITVRKKAEAALQRSEGRFRELLEEMDLIAVLLDEAGIVTFANECLSRISGWTREELLGTNWLEVMIPKEIQSEMREIHKKVLNAGDPMHFENEILTKSGERRLIRFSNIFLKDETGRPIGSASIGEDVTEYRQAEARLAEKHRLLTAITEGTSDVIFIKDLEGRYLFMNTAGAKASGKPAAEIIGASDAEWIMEQDQHVLESGQINTVEEHVLGQTFLTKKWPLCDEDGHKIGLIGIARDITDLKRAKALSDALNEINISIGGTLDFDRIMGNAISRAAEAMESDAAAIALQEGNGWVVPYLHGCWPPEFAGTQMTADQLRGAEEAVRTGAPVICNDSLADTRFDTDFLNPFGIRSFIVVPLMIKGTAIGVMTFFHHDEPRVFSEEEIDFAGKVAMVISLALENSHLYEGQREIAEALQETLLVMPEHMDGLAFGHVYRSAAQELARAGGDFYDLFEVDEDSVGIIIGDVSGKGLEAATLTSVVKNMLRAYAYEHDSPAEALRRVNNALVRTTPPAVFITVFLGILNKRTGSMSYSGAGHPPPILKTRSNKARFLETNGIVLGVFGDQDYQDSTTKLASGDVLCLFTDGITEARRVGELYGLERLKDAVESLPSAEPSNLPDAILAEALAYSDSPLADDVAILAVALRS